MIANKRLEMLKLIQKRRKEVCPIVKQELTLEIDRLDEECEAMLEDEDQEGYSDDDYSEDSGYSQDYINNINEYLKG